MHGQGQLVQVKTRMSPELAQRVDAFAQAYGFTRASAVVALVALGFTEFDALLERARQQLDDPTYVPVMERTE